MSENLGDGRRNEGFTLIELLLVMVLVAILVAGSIQSYKVYINKGMNTVTNMDMQAINVTVDYFEEFNDRLPNIHEIEVEMGREGYRFSLTGAVISVVQGVSYITIRAETHLDSRFHVPYAITLVAEYSGEFGVLPHGAVVDIVVNREGLMDYNVESISMLIIDNTPSGVDEIIWVN